MLFGHQQFETDHDNYDPDRLPTVMDIYVSEKTV